MKVILLQDVKKVGKKETLLIYQTDMQETFYFQES